MKLYRSAKAGKEILRTYDKLLELWNVEKEEKDIPTSCGSTHVLIWGEESKPPLVLFHGVGDDAALMWLYNAKALSRHFRLFAIDTIGGPGKSRPNKNYNKQFDDAGWIDEILTGLGLGRVHIAGVSHGAFLAQYYLLRRAERVTKILCMAGSVPAGDSGPMKTMLKIFLPEALFPTRRNTIRLLRKLTGENSGVFTENQAVFEHFRALLKGYNNMAMAYHKVEPFRDEQIAALRDRSLFLAGEEDPFMKLGGKNTLLQYKMNAKFFPKAGHGLNHELSEKINQEIIDYFH